MAIGKNKRLTKGKKGGKKKIIDSMSRKDWFDFKAPAPFDSRAFGKTCITKTSGTRIATEQIKGRVVEVSLADLKNNSDNLVNTLFSFPTFYLCFYFCRHYGDFGDRESIFVCFNLYRI